MKRAERRACLIAVFSLLLCVIWQSPAAGASAPVFEPLGRITDGLNVPQVLDVDGQGNLYVADSRRKILLKFDKYGRKVAEFDQAPVTGFGVAVTPDGSRVYVSGPTVVSVLDGSSGEVIGTLGTGAGEFRFASEIDLDASGRIFVADGSSLVIRVYDSAGAFLYHFGGRGMTAGKFWSIWGMGVNEYADEVYVADNHQYGSYTYPKVQVFDLAGNLKSTYRASNGFGPLPLWTFSGFAFDPQGRGYFLDKLRGAIQILNLPGGYLSSYIESGYNHGELSSPKDAAFDPLTGRLFVTCAGARVEILGVDGGQNPLDLNEKPGKPVALSPVADSEVATATPELSYQNAVDPDEDSLTYDVQVFAADGDVVADYVGLPESESTSYAQVDVELAENARFEWSVQAFDGQDPSGWIAPESFYVNAVQEPPTVPVLIASPAGESLDGDGVLSWQEAVDPDPFDEVGYVVEIALDAGFTSVVVEETTSATSLTLGELADYLALQDGTTYYWRVIAVDNHEVRSEPSTAGTFVYDTTMLQVIANMPGAKVYVGGNFGYPGHYLGEVALEVRDFRPGPASLVIERSGFEPLIAQISPAYRENVSVYAELVPAFAPADLKARPLETALGKLTLGSNAAPYLVDFDNDGLIDLLTGEASGAVNWYRGNLTDEGDFYYGGGSDLDLPLVPGATPFVVDWDNDGRKDLLLGAADGSVILFANIGSEEAPAFGGGEFLQAAGAPVAVVGEAAPVVIDIDADGDKDLVVGCASGAVKLYRNIGEDGDPELAAPVALVSLSSPVSPVFSDWDGDGDRELLLASSEHLYLYEPLAGGSYRAVTVLTVGDDLLGKNGISSSGAFSLGDRLRLFAFDTDGRNGKDLVVGNAAGEIRLVHSYGDTWSAAFVAALADKVAQIETLATGEAPDLLPQIGDLAAAIGAEDWNNASRKVRDLERSAPAGSELASAVSELGGLLK